MSEPDEGDDLRAPLAAFGGAMPPAPVWFDDALAHTPERGFVDVGGVPIETLSWGERGKPGLLFLHGNGAHADWWSFIAPFFAVDHRVVALSWSGMGGSGHREHYRLDDFVAEAFEVGAAEGLFDAREKPIFVAHSFGGYPLMACASRHGGRLRAAVMVDTPVTDPASGGENRRPPNAPMKPHRVYPTIEAALARFRFAPTQGCDNLYIADLIARRSIKEVDGGWTWKFDPFLWRDFAVGDSAQMLARVGCPFAIMWGERSKLMPSGTIDFMRQTAPAGSPLVVVPDAAHHVMIDQPLAFVAALRALVAGWPR